MKITRKQLRQIIKEESRQILEIESHEVEPTQDVQKIIDELKKLGVDMSEEGATRTYDGPNKEMKYEINGIMGRMMDPGGQTIIKITHKRYAK